MSNTHTTYLVGHNDPGYLPDNEPWTTNSFEHARLTLVAEMLSFMDDMDELDAEAITHAAEDVNLWSGPDTVTVAGIAFWIVEDEDPEDDEDPNLPDTWAEYAERLP